MAKLTSVSLKTSLIVSFLLILLVPSLIIAFISYANTKEQIHHSMQVIETATGSLLQMSETLHDEIKRFTL